MVGVEVGWSPKSSCSVVPLLASAFEAWFLDFLPMVLDIVSV